MTRARAARSERVAPVARSRGVLAFGLLAGPVAWFGHVDASYVVAPAVCDGLPGWIFHVVTAAAALIAAGGGAVSLWAYRRTRGAALGTPWPGPPDAGDEGDRSAGDTIRREIRALVALTGLLLSAFFLLLILTQGYPTPLPGDTCGRAPTLDRTTIVRSAGTLFPEPHGAAGAPVAQDGHSGLVAGPTLAGWQGESARGNRAVGDARRDATLIPTAP